MAQENGIILYDHNGDAITHADEVSMAPLTPKEEAEYAKIAKSMLFNMALRDTKSPAQRRAQDPYCNHPWVYASASANADNLAQVDFIIWRETEAEQQNRAQAAFRNGYVGNPRHWVPNRGKRRSVCQRHLWTRTRMNGLRVKALEPDLDHPLAPVLRKPNDFMTGNDLWKATDVYFQMRGMAFWLLVTPDGTPWFPGDEVEQILYLHPDDMKPVIDRRTMRFVAWEFTVTNKSEGLGLGAEGSQKRYMPSEVIQFKNFNMDNPVIGLSPLNPIAGNIIQDLMTQQVNTAILENGADPGGILTSDDPIDPKEKRKIIKKWHDRHGGPHNQRKVAILDGNLKWQQTSLSPKDMEYETMGNVNRESVMAVLRTNKSVLGLTEDINHATHLAQDRAFWQRSLLPRVRVYENTIDSTLLLTEPDTVVGAFRLEDVEALQEDLTSKIANAKELCGTEIHMPPGQALELVGIDAASYDGSDEALITPLLTTVDDVLTNPALEVDDDEDEDTDGTEPIDDEGDEEEDEGTRTVPTSRRLEFKRPAASKVAHVRGLTTAEYAERAIRGTTAVRDAYARLVGVHEKPYKARFKGHVFNLRKDTLKRFEAIADGKKAVIRADLFSRQEIERMLFDLQQANAGISQKTLALYQAMLEAVTDFTDSEMGGLFAFDIAGEKVQNFLNTKAIQVQGVNKRIRDNIRRAIIAGVENNEDVAGIRQRIKQAFNTQVSPFRVNRIARTETAQLMSGIRQIIFREEGVRKIQWVTAGDELVREDHVTLGNTDPVPIGHNFMADLGKSGTLEFPSDPRGPAEQIVNCRCVAVAVE